MRGCLKDLAKVNLLLNIGLIFLHQLPCNIYLKELKVQTVFRYVGLIANPDRFWLFQSRKSLEKKKDFGERYW